MPAIRQCYDALNILGIQESIIPIPRARIHRDAFENPLLTLTLEERELIGDMFAFCSKTWPSSLEPLYVSLIKQLHLSRAQSDEKLSERVYTLSILY